MKKKAVSIMLIVLDMILLVLFVFVLTRFFRSVIRPDVIEYENWNGQLENPLVLRLGSGFWGLVFILIRMIGFSLWQKKLLKGSRVLMVIAIILHIVIGVLGILYWVKWGDGPFFFYMIQLLIGSIFA